MHSEYNAIFYYCLINEETMSASCSKCHAYYVTGTLEIPSHALIKLFPLTGDKQTKSLRSNLAPVAQLENRTAAIKIQDLKRSSFPKKS
jgi:hypothetical protein